MAPCWVWRWHSCGCASATAAPAAGSVCTVRPSGCSPASSGGWLAARARARTFRQVSQQSGGRRLHSLPVYHGWFVALAIIAPALLFAAIWSSVTPGLAEAEALTSPAAAQLPAFGFERDAILAAARNLATAPGAGKASCAWPDNSMCRARNQRQAAVPRAVSRSCRAGCREWRVRTGSLACSSTR